MCVFPVCVQALYTALLLEDVALGRVVVKVGASDPDLGLHSWLQYSLQGPGALDFTMDPDTGNPLCCYTQTPVCMWWCVCVYMVCM